MRTVRLALLACASTKIGADRGGRILRQFLSSSLELITTEVTLTLDAYNVFNDMPYPPDDIHYDGILIDGSCASTWDGLERSGKLIAYLKCLMVLKPSVKIFGFCFGHQVIAKALGLSVKRGDFEVSVTTIHLTSIGKAIFNTNKLDLHQLHHDQVSTSLPAAQLLGSTVMSLNQGLVVFDNGQAPLRTDRDSDALRVPLTSIHVLTFQAHPEFTEPVMRVLIPGFADEHDWDQKMVDEALSRVGLPTDAIDKVGRTIWGVLGVADVKPGSPDKGCNY